MYIHEILTKINSEDLINLNDNSHGIYFLFQKIAHHFHYEKQHQITYKLKLHINYPLMPL